MASKTCSQWSAQALASLCATLLICCGSESTATLSGDTDPSAAEIRGSLWQPALGKGVDYAETKTYRRCVTAPLMKPQKGFSESLYEEQVIKSRRDLDEKMRVEASVSAKGLWGKGTVEGSYFKAVEFNEDSLFWLVDAKYSLLDTGIDTGSVELRLTDDARSILEGPGGLEAFSEACGEFFYSGQSIGARYALLYEFSSRENKAVEKIKTSGSYAGWGVEAKAEFEKFVSMAQKTSNLTIHAATNGGSAALLPYAKDPVALDEQLRLLKQALYDDGAGTVTEWFMTDYNGFPEYQAAKRKALDALRERAATSEQATRELQRAQRRWNLPSHYKEDALSLYYNTYVDIADDMTFLRGLQKKSEGDRPLLYYSPTKLSKIGHQLSEHAKFMADLAKQARTCVHGDVEDCSTAQLFDHKTSSRGKVFTEPDKDLSTLSGWIVLPLGDAMQGVIDLVAISPNGARTVRYQTGTALLGTAHGVAAIFRGNGLATSQDIGTGMIVPDPVNGQPRLDFCIYRFASSCSLRLLEPYQAPPQSSEAPPRLELTLYDQDGFPKANPIVFSPLY